MCISDDPRDLPLSCETNLSHCQSLLLTRTPRQRRGGMLGMITFLMVTFMIVAALMIDIARVQLARTELRTATDAAAKAAAENLSRTFDPAQARQQGTEIAAQNQVMGRRLLLAEGNFEFGYTVEEKETGQFLFFPNRFPKNSVRVTGTPAGAGPDGDVPLLLGNILGRGFFDVRASATATCVEGDVVLTLSTIMAE